MLARFASRCNDLPIWRRRVRVWGYDMEACNGDRLLNLCLHSLGVMGAGQRRIYESLLRPGFHVVDIGANQGLYSLLFSQLVSPHGRVSAFEPDAALFASLRANCERNGANNIAFFNYAIGAKKQTLTLYHSRVNSGDNRLAVSERPEWFSEAVVNVAPLDSFLPDDCIDFIKIDVQGWEFEVLKGMTEIWRKNPALSIYFEFWPFGLRRAGCSPVELLAHCRKHGFGLYDMAQAAPRPIEDLAAFCAGFEGYKATNVLAVRPDSPPPRR